MRTEALNPGHSRRGSRGDQLCACECLGTRRTRPSSLFIENLSTRRQLLTHLLTDFPTMLNNHPWVTHVYNSPLPQPRDGDKESPLEVRSSQVTSSSEVCYRSRPVSLVKNVWSTTLTREGRWGTGMSRISSSVIGKTGCDVCVSCLFGSLQFTGQTPVVDSTVSGVRLRFRVGVPTRE